MIPGVWHSDSTMDDVPGRHGKEWVPAAGGKQNLKMFHPTSLLMFTDAWVAEKSRIRIKPVLSRQYCIMC